MLDAALKQFLDAVVAGEDRRDLFLFERKTFLELFKLELADAANERGLCPVVNTTQNRITFDGTKSAAILAVAYPEISYRFSGLYWSAVHGLETLDKYPDTVEADKARFATQIRSL